MPSFLIPEFVGREPLLKEAAIALKAGSHVFVHGPFGIGKTTFARQVLKNIDEPEISVSLEDEAHDIALQMTRQAARYRHLLRKKPPKLTSKKSFSNYKTFRELKGEVITASKDIRYLIVDNVFRVTHQKIKFLRFLLEHGFKLIVIIESDRFEKDTFLFRSICHPHIQIKLPRLNKKETALLISQYAHLHFNPAKVTSLVNQLNGYPLSIVERMNRL